MIGCGMSGSFGQLLAWRWVTGVGSALQMSGSQLYLADISMSSNRARTMGTNQVPPCSCLQLVPAPYYLLRLRRRSCTESGGDRPCTSCQSKPCAVS